MTVLLWVIAPLLGCMLGSLALGMVVGHTLRPDRMVYWSAGVAGVLAVALVVGPFWT